MKTALDGLNISMDLVLEFFAAFSRLEYAMKEDRRFCRRGSGDSAQPDWAALKEIVGQRLESVADEATSKAIAVLLDEPPLVQRYRDGVARFEERAIKDVGKGRQAIEAAYRVRNNLFHGGKHSRGGQRRNEELLRASLRVVIACVGCDDTLAKNFAGDHGELLP